MVNNTGRNIGSGNGNNTPVRKKRKAKRKARIFSSIILALVMVFLICVLMVGGWVIGLSSELPDISAEDLISAQTSFIYDGDGIELASLHGAENRISVDLSEMPDYLIDAVVATEDERFYEHSGVDYRSVMRAVVIDVRDTLKNRSVTFTQGASTITMQLVRNVIDETEKTMTRKVKEALLALQFEKSYDKDQILYYYLNEIYIGPNTYGMQAAAQYYFGKDVGDISISEAALLAGLLRNPGFYSPYSNPEGALNLRNTVLNNLIKYDKEKYGVLAEEAKADELVVVESSSSKADYDYPWFIDHVIAECSTILTDMGLSGSAVYSGGLQIYTTIDRSVQDAMEKAYANDDNFPASSTKDIVESGMVIIDPSTGAIRGIMGGRVYETKRGFNRGTDLVRSSGSTIKPLVTYGPAVELGYGAGYAINDSPLPGKYSPNNSDHTFRGRISMRKAIMGSRNVCAVRMLSIITPEVGWSFGVKLGLPLVPEDANLSMTLGGLTYGVAPIDMAGAFAAFANEGIFTEPYSVTKILDSSGNVLYSAVPEQTEVFSPQTAYIMTDMLMSAVSGGTGTNAKLAKWQTAGKTGTNELPSKEDKDYAGLSGTKDAWFVGYTPVLVGAVWMGYDNKKDEDGKLQYLKNVYGGSAPAKLWKAVMTEALANYEIKTFAKPEGITSVTIDTKSGMLPGDLTPSEFIGSEIYSTDNMPTQTSDIWTRVEICEDSGKLAGTYCPNTTTAVRIKWDSEDPPSERAADYYLYAPSATCSLHNSYQSGLVAVSICTDPRHNGEKVLATTGCDPKYVETRYYLPGSVPTTYCNLEDHEGTAIPPVDTGNNGKNGDNHDEEVTSLSKPTNVSASVTGSSCYITWSSDNDASTTKYIVERTTDGSDSTAVRFVVMGNSCTDSSLEKGHSYSYRVYAYNEEYNVISKWSSSVNVSY